jgi:hypothetical protein
MRHCPDTVGSTQLTATRQTCATELNTFLMVNDKPPLTAIQPTSNCPCERAAVRLRFSDGAVLGKRYFTDDNLPGWGLKFPETGWAPLDSVRAGEWQKFEPQPVRIFASRFVCFDPAWEQPRYFPLKPGEFIQGLLARINLNARVYVVTLPPPAEYSEFQRWPRIVSARVPKNPETTR